MFNEFKSGTVVPNGYVYTSNTGAKYVFLECMWFNANNMMLVDPQKYGNMYLSATAQINEYNKSPYHDYKIGSTYVKENKECVFLGEAKFSTANGDIINEAQELTELISDESRVYDVPKSTLQKEWEMLQYYILPPHSDDIAIPAGMVVQGHKYIPNSRGFVNSTGKGVDSQLNRKLQEEGVRLSRQSASGGDKLIPIKSLLVHKNGKRGEWNGTSFCDNYGNDVISPEDSKQVFDTYHKFVDENKELFPSLFPVNNKEQRFGVGDKPEVPKGFNAFVKPKEKEEVHEADDSESTSAEVPDGIRVTSKSGNTYQKKGGKWYNIETKKPLNSSAAQGAERSAQKMIEEHNSNPNNIKIGSTVTSKSGKTYTYIGDSRFVGTDGKLLPKSTADQLIQKHQEEKSSQSGEESEVSPEDTTQNTSSDDTGSSTVNAGSTEQSTQEEPEKAPQSDSGSPMQGLADKINASPFAPKIKVLLTRGDKVSLLAADILLSGKRDQVKEIIKTLNNNNE